MNDVDGTIGSACLGSLYAMYGPIFILTTLLFRLSFFLVSYVELRSVKVWSEIHEVSVEMNSTMLESGKCWNHTRYRFQYEHLS